MLLDLRRPPTRAVYDSPNSGVQRCCIASFCGHAAQVYESREIPRLHGENLLQQLLKFHVAILVTLTLYFRGKPEERPQIPRIDGYRLTKIRDGGCGVAAISLKKTQQVVNTVIVRSKRMCTIQPLCRSIKASLPQGEYAPIHPARRLCRNQLCGTLQVRVRTNIVPHLQARQTGVESGNKVDIGLGSDIW